jgi:hypothetical protein
MKRAVLLVWIVACGGAPSKPKPVDKGPTCVATADHMHTLIEPKDDHAKRIREIFATRCEVDKWDGSARACIVSTTSLKDKKGCKAKLSKEQRESLERDLDEADRVARASKLPAPCERYRQLIEKLASCDKMPQQSRDALKQGFDAMNQTWKEMGDMPPEARKAMEEACTQGADALQQAASAMCGW